MNKNGYRGLQNYIDDLVYCGLHSVIRTPYQFLCTLQELGLQISHKKFCVPSIQVVCLGILFYTVKRTISILEQKLHDINPMCIEWSGEQIVSKNELQSLLASLL